MELIILTATLDVHAIKHKFEFILKNYNISNNILYWIIFILD